MYLERVYLTLFLFLFLFLPLLPRSHLCSDVFPPVFCLATGSGPGSMGSDLGTCNFRSVRLVFNCFTLGSEMAHRVKTLEAKPDHRRAIPGAHMVEGKNTGLPSEFHIHTGTCECNVHACVHTCTNVQINKNHSKILKLLSLAFVRTAPKAT